ncbi:scaffold protein [Lactococcus phage PLgT-1]|uniref:Phage scaffold protein n=2 Tax=Lactococcus garvieae TaxID=1363 RepID=F9VE38_LACGL|nr:head scaffolding protein [Lactococcus phage PLgT-1]ANA49636.1 scaffold protein [Lactococcus phage PLgT-1]BAK58622.1 phage scaffold protein [Lactococcus garvieae ATCC 49156]BAK60589.1 phage scaffold protein [Lactococcus garvieae Lg2]
MERNNTMNFKTLCGSELLKLNLQLFAGGQEGGDGGAGTGQATPPEFNADSLTDEQVAAIKEKFGLKDDTDVDSIVKSKRSRWQKELEEEKNEAARLAKLSEEERQQALIQKEKDDFEQEKAAFRQEQLLVEKGKQLQEIGIPSAFAARIQGNTAEEAIKDVKSFKAEWDKALEAAVNEKLKASVDTPLGGGATPGKPVDISTLTYEEALALKKTNPKAYEQATK